MRLGEGMGWDGKGLSIMAYEDLGGLLWLLRACNRVPH